MEIAPNGILGAIYEGDPMLNGKTSKPRHLPHPRHVKAEYGIS
jgi:hypothetical protein